MLALTSSYYTTATQLHTPSYDRFVLNVPDKSVHSPYVISACVHVPGVLQGQVRGEEGCITFKEEKVDTHHT